MSMATHKAVFKFRIRWDRHEHAYELEVQRTYYGSSYYGLLPHFLPLGAKPRSRWQRFWNKEGTYWSFVSCTASYPSEAMRDALKAKAQEYADKELKAFVVNKTDNGEIVFDLEMTA